MNQLIHDVKNRDERKGFTLVEMIVVVALILILAAIGFVSMLHYRTIIRVNASARELAGQMRLARAQAIRNGKPMMVRFNSAGNYYEIGQSKNENNTFDSFWRTERLEPGIGFGFYGGISGIPGHPSPPIKPVDIRLGAQNYVHFRHDGTASYSGAVYISPVSDLAGTAARDDRNRAVDWDAATGRIRSWKWQQQAHQWR